MNKSVLVILMSILMLSAPSCSRTDLSGPPTVLIGDSTCAECGMIISDERFATATVDEQDRGPISVLFDDFNCQMIYESKMSDLTILKRWSRDHSGLQWLNTESGWFAKSNQIRSPMASGMAFFETRKDAQAFGQSINAEILSFESAWKLND